MATNKLKKECPFCGSNFQLRGYDAHVRSCPEQFTGIVGTIENSLEQVWQPIWKSIKLFVTIFVLWVVLNVTNWLMSECLTKSSDLYTMFQRFHLKAKIDANNDLKRRRSRKCSTLARQQGRTQSKARPSNDSRPARPSTQPARG